MKLRGLYNYNLKNTQMSTAARQLLFVDKYT